MDDHTFKFLPSLACVVASVPAIKVSMEAAPYDDVKAVLGNLGSSNEARIALLERRLRVPASPVDSVEAAGVSKFPPAGHSLHSAGSGMPQHSGPSGMTTPQASRLDAAFSNDGVADTTIQQAKKRRLQLGGATSTGAKRETSTTPTNSARPSLSPYLAANEPHPPTKPHAGTPGSKGKQKNTISRYFLQAKDGGDAAAGAKDPAPAKLPTAVAPGGSQNALEKECRYLR